MKAKTQISIDDCHDEALDFIARIIFSYGCLKSTEDERLFDYFWSSFLPSGVDTVKNAKFGAPYLCNRPDGTNYLPDAFVMFHKLLGFIPDSVALHAAAWNAFINILPMFYWPGANRIKRPALFPEPCSYEVIMPYKQPKRSSIVVLIVPAGVKSGDTTLALRMELLPHVTRTSWLNGVVNAVRAPRKRLKEPERNNAFLKNVTDAISAQKTNIYNDLVYKNPFCAAITLSDEPYLRFPCYSVPLQVIYEMLSAEIGDFWAPKDYLFSEWLAEKRKSSPDTTEVRLTRKPLTKDDGAIIMALMCWPLWQMARIKNADQYKHLQQLLLSVNMQTFFGKSKTFSGSVDRLRKACTRKISEHLKTKHPRKVRCFQR